MCNGEEIRSGFLRGSVFWPFGATSFAGKIENLLTDFAGQETEIGLEEETQSANPWITQSSLPDPDRFPDMILEIFFFLSYLIRNFEKT